MIAYKSWYADKKIYIKDSQGSGISTDNIEQALDYLITSNEQWNVVWDIDIFVAPLLKLFDSDSLKNLWETGKVRFGQYTVTYNQAKSLCVRRGGAKVSYYWLEQFYLEEPEPELLSIVEKGNALLKELASIGIYPTRLTSCVAIFDHIFDQLKLPTYHDLPDKVNQWCYSQKGRAWTEAFKLGHFKSVTDLDINSCFPSVMADLYDTRYGEWVEDTKEPSGAVYGVLSGELDIDSYLNPFLNANTLGNVFSVNGERPAVISKDGLSYLKEYKAGSFKTDDAFWWIPKKRYQPLQYTVRKMFGERKRHSKAVGRVFKGGLNGIYGRFYQEFKDGSLGEHVNPLWGYLVEDGARLKVARFIKQNNLEQRLLSISTDGIMVEGDIDYPSSSKMGEWRIDNKGEALIVSSGTIFFGDKHPCSIYYPEALKMIQDNPDAQEWHKSSKRLMTIGDALLGFSDELGTYQEVAPGFGLCFDHDRHFTELPQNGKDLLSRVYQSSPLNISAVS